MLLHMLVLLMSRKVVVLMSLSCSTAADNIVIHSYQLAFLVSRLASTASTSATFPRGDGRRPARPPVIVRRTVGL